MGFFSKLFKKKNSSKKSNKNIIQFENPECQSLWELNCFIDNLLAKDTYIAKSEYHTKLLKKKKTIEYFGVLQNSKLLDAFCKNNGLSVSVVEEVLAKYLNIENLTNEHNESFIHQTMNKEKNYLDNSLVIAGAGAGKTTTVAAKVKYLVEKKDIEPSQILVVSFTNKAVQELRDKLNRDLKIDCPIATFHSTGNAILRKQSPEKLNIVDSSKLYFVLQDYFKNSILKNESLVNNLIMFFASYFDAPFEGNDLNVFFNKIAKSKF